MRKLLLSLFFQLIFGVAIAQNSLPNFDFETWQTFGQPPTNYEDPQGWSSSNASVVFTTTPVDKTTDKYSGTYAAEIKAVQVFGTLPPTILCNGTVPPDFQTYTPAYVRGGTPISIKPFQVKGYYKYSRDTAFQDSAFAVVILKKYNAALQKIDTVAIGTKVFAPAAGYTSFSIPINYLLGNQNPDSIVVAFGNQARVQKQMQPTGKFIVDKVELDTLPAGAHEVKRELAVKVYPNPVRNTAMVSIQGAVPSATDPLQFEMYDILGKQVELLNVETDQFCISHQDHPGGLYFYKLKKKGSVVYSGKLVME